MKLLKASTEDTRTASGRRLFQSQRVSGKNNCFLYDVLHEGRW